MLEGVIVCAHNSESPGVRVSGHEFECHAAFILFFFFVSQQEHHLRGEVDTETMVLIKTIVARLYL